MKYNKNIKLILLFILTIHLILFLQILAGQGKSSQKAKIAKNYKDQPVISNVFYETDLRQALQDIAAQAEIAIVADNSVQGFVTMEIIDMPLELALKRVLSIGGFTFNDLKRI